MAVFTIGSKTLSGSPTGGAVGGASNLTTVGAIPYVSASGVLNQDATALFWDATNDRLGVGTASPSVTLEVAGIAVSRSNTTIGAGATFGFQVRNTTFDNYRVGIGYDSTKGGVLQAYEQGVSWERPLIIQPSGGNLLIGGTTDGNYKLDIQASGSTGTLRVYDQTAVTGSTKAVVRAGAGDVYGSWLTEWQDSSGTRMGGVQFLGGSVAQISGLGYFSGGLSVPIGGTPNFASTGFMFSVTASAGSGTYDLGLSRNAAGVIEINNGTPGTPRDLKLRNITVMDTTAVTGSTLAIIQAGAGQSGNLQEWQNNAGSALAAIDSSGNVIPNSLVVGTTAITSTGLAQGSARVLTWSSTTNYFGTADLGLARNAAGVLEIDSGTAGQYRDLLLRRSQHSGVAVSALPAAAAGNAGSIQYVTDANATTIGSTVAGGGSNKVMVWSDGTNWKIFAS